MGLFSSLPSFCISFFFFLLFLSLLFAHTSHSPPSFLFSLPLSSSLAHDGNKITLVKRPTCLQWNLSLLNNTTTTTYPSMVNQWTVLIYYTALPFFLSFYRKILLNYSYFRKQVSMTWIFFLTLNLNHQLIIHLQHLHQLLIILSPIVIQI